MTPTFCLTFDTELVWGSFDRTSAAAFDRAYPDVRGVVNRLLGLLDRYEIPATWAVVGHLFLDACERDPLTGVAHPELPRPPLADGSDWLSLDPCTDRQTDPLWYGSDLVARIRAAEVSHEIGCHSFVHRPFNDPALGHDDVLADLRACFTLAEREGIDMRSFVFPRNLEGHHAALREAGFGTYRGADPVWYGRMPGLLRRVGHLMDQAFAVAPPVSVPSERLPGLWNIPGSMLILDRRGLRRLVTSGARTRKARGGLRRAIERDAVFHLWTHPFNLASHPNAQLRFLEEIVREASDLRAQGRLLIEPMSAVAARAAGEKARGI